MDNYISQQAAIDACYDGYADCRDDCANNIRNLPPADVRPVVLCKDCVMYRRDKEVAEASYLDPNYYCGLLRCEMPGDGFCSYGNMRGGDFRMTGTPNDFPNIKFCPVCGRELPEQKKSVF